MDKIEKHMKVFQISTTVLGILSAISIVALVLIDVIEDLQ